MNLGLRLGLGAPAAAAPSVMSETETWAAALTTPPTDERKALVDALITGLKSDGTWDTLDWLLLLAGADEQASLVNVRNPEKSAINQGMTFAADSGFTGNASSAYLSLGESPDASGANNWSLNSAALGVWCNAQAGSSGAFPHFCTSSARLLGTARDTSGNELFQLNDATSETAQANPGTRVGHRSYSRTGAGVKRAFYDGTRTADLTTASTSLAASNLFIGRGTGSYSPDQFAAFWSGGGKSDADVAAIHDRLSTILAAIGAIAAPAYLSGLGYDTEWTQNSAISSITLDSCFSGDGNSYSVVEGSLPTGVSLSTGTISGTPTGFQGREWITIRATNAAGTADRRFLLSVRPDTSAGAFGVAYGTTYSGQSFSTTTLDGASNVVAINCTFTGTLTLRSCTNILLIGCTFNHTAETDGIRISNTGTGCDNIVIYDNEIENDLKDGINISGDAINGDLYILNNYIHDTGNNAGFEHGIYCWCYANIVGNVIKNCDFGNGVSMRSSGRVANNFIDTTYESGVSYYADHPADTPDLLLIEGNVIVGTGTNGSDTDIRLRDDPSSGANLIAAITARNNFLTMDDRDEIIVGTGYSGVTLTESGNTLITDAAARAMFP
jgi:hypothetical protein